MAQTVNECLTAGLDSVQLIDAVRDGTYNSQYMTQTEINKMVQRNVDHLKIILEYTPVDSNDDKPDVKGSTNSKKTYCYNAIETGEQYILENS